MRQCEVCFKGKKIKTQNKKSVPKAKELLECVHIDIWGPYMKVTNHWGFKYFILMMDCKLRKTSLCLLKDHTAKVITKILDEWVALVERQMDRKVKSFQIDNTPEFKLLEKIWGILKGIEFRFTEAY